MCGEHELTGTYIFERYSPIHRIAGSTCKGGVFDALAGAAQALMEYNGLKRGVSHLRDKLVELMSIGEMCYGSGVASAAMAYKAPSGAMIPDPVMGNASKMFAARNIYEAARLATDIAGGLIATIPSWKDYENPETKKYMDKYLKGTPDVPVEHRMRLFKFLQTSISQSSMCPNVVLGAGTDEDGFVPKTPKIVEAHVLADFYTRLDLHAQFFDEPNLSGQNILRQAVSRYALPQHPTRLLEGLEDLDGVSPPAQLVCDSEAGGSGAYHSGLSPGGLCFPLLSFRLV